MHCCSLLRGKRFAGCAGLLLVALAVLLLGHTPWADAFLGGRYDDGIQWAEPKVITPGDNNSGPPSP